MWPADLDPADLRQPDRFSCGAASVVAARAIADPGFRPGDPARAILAAHERLTGLRGPDGGLQAPWPPWLGTPPWAVAGALDALAPGVRHRTRWARTSRGRAFDALHAAAARRPVGLYVGSRLLPRHVVLAVGTDDAQPGRVRIFDPGRGRLQPLDRAAFVGGTLAVSGWSHPWFVVRPTK